jgi:hypothetical protein
VITEERVMTLFEHANPVRSLDDLEPVDVGAAGYLATLEQRSSEMTQIETIPETKPPGRSRGPLIAAAVAAVLLIATIGILLTNRDEQPAVAPVVPTTSAVVPTTIASLEGITPEEALSVADSYFTAFNAGDADAVMALFTPDVVVADNFEGDWDLTEWEETLIWDTAQRTTHGQADCQVTEQTSDEVTLVCVTEILQGVTRAVNSSGVPATITMVVTSEGLSELQYAYGSPDFLVVGRPFAAWMAAQYADDPEAVGFGNWLSREDARQGGLLRAQRAEQWVAFATGAVEQAFADFNAGDLDGFMSRLSTLTVNLDGAREDAGDLFAAQMAANTQYTLDQCAPSGASGIGMLVECEFTTTNGSASTAGTVLMRVNAQGAIASIAITND